MLFYNADIGCWYKNRAGKVEPHRTHTRQTTENPSHAAQKAAKKEAQAQKGTTRKEKRSDTQKSCLGSPAANHTTQVVTSPLIAHNPNIT